MTELDALSRTRKEKAAEVQRSAARPDGSVWVAASAGSGKTKVLTDRVLNLLLHGTPPQRILCLTFTKAAAAEMANRLANRLAVWATCEDHTLREELADLLGCFSEECALNAGRTLFPCVLDAPGGLRIQTIHAFCQSLLTRFPLEAGVAPHFRVLDDRSAAEMLDSARTEVLARAQLRNDPDLTAAIESVTTYAQEQKFTDLLAELIKERGRLTRLLRNYGGSKALEAAICRLLDVDSQDSPESLLVRLCHDGEFDCEGLERVCRALEAGGQAEVEKSKTLRRWLATPPDERFNLFASYRAFFLTQEEQPRAWFWTNAAANAVPGSVDVMKAEAQRLQKVCALLRAVRVARSTVSLLRLGQEILAAYEARKQAQCLLDYDDLILKSVDLLHSRGMASWVLYKLDGGVDHVLIDEAQDTNPEQWQVIEALTDEFFAGQGSRSNRRTIFAVGDAKQSIFSFQRADAAEFARMRDRFASKVRAAGQDWTLVDLDVSFRSTEAVLSTVDRVFASLEAHDGVLMSGQVLRHETVRIGQGGVVELWPPASPDEEIQQAAWEPPTRQHDEQAARARLAVLIAAKIRRWTLSSAGQADPEAMLASQGRRLKPGDILVLVRRRNEFVEELVRELKLRGVPVAGIDRMVLTDQLAVMDLVALGRALLLPEDDLTLATVLRGPLIGLDEEQIFLLAQERSGSLWAELRRRRGDNEAFARAYDVVAELRAHADYVRPFELYAEVLGARRGREKLLRRLGPDAKDPMDEFLSLALAFEREHVPSLEGFLHWLEAGRQEIKRDLEHGNDAVRIMTVHGAKGLQAPVVFLPDTLQGPPPHTGLLWSSDESVVLWPLRKEFDGPVAESAREATRHAQEQEYRRLLYVALTRAEDRLYVCGWETKRAAIDGCWYNMIKRALVGVAERTRFDFRDDIPGGWEGEGWRLSTPQRAKPEEDLVEPEVPGGYAQLPGLFCEPCQTEPTPRRPVAPSRPADAEPSARSPIGIDDGFRFHRGRLIHRLLQFLPDLSLDRRQAAARDFLARPVHGLAGDQQQQILGEVFAVLSDLRFAALFGPSSRAEVSLAGVVGEGLQVVSGQVDRLAVTVDEVLVVDYKTNRTAPTSDAEVPKAYVRQMAAYHALLRQIYPDRRVKCLILWTEGPHLTQISDAALADHAP